MCRAKLVAGGSKEETERLRGWAKKGKAWAIAFLAGRYLGGFGVKQSDKKGIELYDMAAKRGNATAQYNLAICYEQGIHGVTQSSTRAIAFYTLAANQGHLDAQLNLGTMYANGKGIETSYSKAREWLTKAAAQGHEHAIKFLKQLDKLGV